MYSGVAGFGWNVNVLTMWSFFLADALFLGLATWLPRYLAQRRAAAAAATLPAPDTAGSATAVAAMSAEGEEIAVDMAPLPLGEPTPQPVEAVSTA
jgi:hypothetical protein